ncbi:MAG: condensation domain-containing protein [Proteobacteria bacterium]|nr:condensation domain-containing protein [Pseudomonadota bacterium]
MVTKNNKPSKLEDETSPKWKMKDIRHPSQLLAVAPFEHYMYADDSAMYPMTVHIRFWFRGQFNKNQFMKALEQVLPEHPLLQATMHGQKWWPRFLLRWKVHQSVTLPWVDWDLQGREYRFPNNQPNIDLRNEIGIRLFIRESENRTELLVTFHHAVSDGKGIFNFIEHLLAQYSELLGGPKRAGLTNQHLLYRRSFFGLTTIDRLCRLWRDLFVLLKFFSMVPISLGRSSVSSSRTVPTNTLAVARGALTEQELGNLKNVAKGSQASVNDVLLKILFLVIFDWNNKNEIKSARQRVTIAVPVCMRGKLFAMMPASNFVSMHVLHVSNKILKKPNELLKHINGIMKFVRAFEMGHTLVFFTSILGQIPFGLSSFFRLPMSKASVVLTNLGVPFLDSHLVNFDGKLASTGVILEHLETLPPIRDRTNASISINSYDKSLQFTMRYNENVFTEVNALEFLKEYIGRLRDLHL